MGYINMPELSKDVQDMINKGVEVIPSEVDYTNYYNKAEISAMAEEISKKISAMLDFNMVYTKISIDNKIDKLKNEINKINSIDTYSKSDIDRIINKIKLDLSNKLNAGDVYSKGEVEKLVNDAISSLGINPDNYYTKQEIDEKLSNVLTKSDVVNTLSSEATDKAVSANQLRIINDNIESLKQSASDGHNRIISTITSVTDELGDDHSYENVCKIIKSRKFYIPKNSYYGIDKDYYTYTTTDSKSYETGSIIIFNDNPLSYMFEFKSKNLNIYSVDMTNFSKLLFGTFSGNLIPSNLYKKISVNNYIFGIGISDKYIFLFHRANACLDREKELLGSDYIDTEEKAIISVISLSTSDIVASIISSDFLISDEYDIYNNDSIVYCKDDYIIMSNAKKVTLNTDTSELNITDLLPSGNNSVIANIDDKFIICNRETFVSDHLVYVYNLKSDTIEKTVNVDITNIEVNRNMYMERYGNCLFKKGSCREFFDISTMRYISIPTSIIENDGYVFTVKDDVYISTKRYYAIYLYIYKNGKLKSCYIDSGNPPQFYNHTANSFIMWSPGFQSNNTKSWAEIRKSKIYEWGSGDSKWDM